MAYVVLKMLPEDLRPMAPIIEEQLQKRIRDMPDISIKRDMLLIKKWIEENIEPHVTKEEADKLGEIIGNS